MTTERPHVKIFPAQPASNSGGAVGFIVGGLAGLALASAVSFEPWFGSPAASLVGGCVLGTLCGVFVGGLRDASQRAQSRQHGSD